MNEKSLFYLFNHWYNDIFCNHHSLLSLISLLKYVYLGVFLVKRYSLFDRFSCFEEMYSLVQKQFQLNKDNQSIILSKERKI